MTITIGKKELYFRHCNADCEAEGYDLQIKNLNTHEVTSGGHITKEEYFYLTEHVREFM